MARSGFGFITACKARMVWYGMVWYGMVWYGTGQACDLLGGTVTDLRSSTDMMPLCTRARAFVSPTPHTSFSSFIATVLGSCSKFSARSLRPVKRISLTCRQISSVE